MPTDIETADQDPTDAICVEEGCTFRSKQEYQAHLYAQLMDENDLLMREVARLNEIIDEHIVLNQTAVNNLMFMVKQLEEVIE